MSLHDTELVHLLGLWEKIVGKRCRVRKKFIWDYIPSTITVFGSFHVDMKQVLSCRETWWKKRHQPVPGGVAVAPVLGAAVNGLVEGWSYGAQQADFVWPQQTAAFKQNPIATDFNGGEALSTVALCGLGAFWTFTKTHQVPIWERQDASPTHMTN